MTGRERFLAAAYCKPVDQTPVWLMRQAGRSLPEYRKLKEQYSFLQLAQTPELALEVTMQPIRRFDYDAAILFSDILVIPEAMGQAYSFREQGGIGMDFAIRSEADIAKLTTEAIPEKLNYVNQALRLIKKELGNSKALLGFGGSPWTLATYMIEGGSSKDFSAVKQFFKTERKLFDQLMEKITASLVDYFKMQIAAGIDAVQIFDSWGGALADEDYYDGSLKWMNRIIQELDTNIPVILFAKGCHQHLDQLSQSGAQVLGIDWTIDMADAAKRIPSNIAMQGNLEPLILNSTPEKTIIETTKVMDAMKGRSGHIFNLGHGIDKDAKLENVAALLETIRNYK